MDSLTQVVLGAAVGEAVLGRKAGPHAMLWGGIAGFLPDLDITSSFVMDEISALKVHRGITHSIFFAVLASFVLGWLVHRLYASGWYNRQRFKAGLSFTVLGTVAFTANFLPYLVTEKINFNFLIGSLLVAALLLFILYRYYVKVELSEVQTTYRDWIWLFFWCIVTHPLLDCFTTYGTQLFLPFSDYRVAFNVISVADPLYTLPFLSCLIIAAALRKGSSKRALINWLGLGISSAYMLFCFTHKLRMNQIFEKSLAEQGIRYERYMTAPVILNNVLWQGCAESDTAYYQGYYSFWGEAKDITHFNVFPKKHELIAKHQEDRSIKVLRWFSNDYYTLLPRKDGSLQYNDVRFGLFGPRLEKDTDYVFKFIIQEKQNGLEVHESEEGREINNEAFVMLWEMMKGNLN